MHEIIQEDMYSMHEAMKVQLVNSTTFFNIIVAISFWQRILPGGKPPDVFIFLVFTKSHDPNNVSMANRRDHPSNTGNREALSSLGLMPSIRYFRQLRASPIFYVELDTKQTQTIQHKAQN